jgi:regulator of sigma E protease
MQFIKSLFGFNRSSQPVDLSVFAGRNIQAGFNFFLFFIAYTSIQIGLFNILPIPMLDGGQAFHYTISALFARFLTEKQVSWFYYLLLLLLAIVFILPKRNRK